MKNWQLVHAAFILGDHSDAVVSAYLDALREEEGITLLEAVARIGEELDAWREERDWEEASRLMNDHGGWRETILDDILNYLEDVPDRVDDWVILRGEFEPEYIRTLINDEPSEQDRYSIVVGARFVLNIVAEAKAEHLRGKYADHPDNWAPTN